jgi:hypothetical protein
LDFDSLLKNYGAAKNKITECVRQNSFLSITPSESSHQVFMMAPYVRLYDTMKALVKFSRGTPWAVDPIASENAYGEANLNVRMAFGSLDDEFIRVFERAFWIQWCK